MTTFAFCATCSEPFELRYRTATTRFCSRACAARSYGPRDLNRMAQIVLAYQQPGATMDVIAKTHGVSRERIRQILRRAGVEGVSGKGWELLDPAEFWRRSTEAVTISDRRLRGSLEHFRPWRRQAVADLKALAASLGRVPTYGELGAFYGLKASSKSHLGTATLMRYGLRWVGSRQTGKNRCSQPRVRGMHRWYRLAGLLVRKSGQSGHREATHR